MKIFLFGYGQMGKEIEKVSIERGHTIHGIVDPGTGDELNINKLNESDVAIDYSFPSSVKKNVFTCFNQGKPIVVGTTGWYNELDSISDSCNEMNGTLFYSPNFSLGVNMFFRINDLLNKLIGNNSDYIPELYEIHHTKKKDAPSGTAINLAKQIVANSDLYEEWVTLKKGEKFDTNQNKNKFPVFYERIDDVVGIHELKYISGVDEITLKHKAFNRVGFALGTLVAAEWVAGKKGIYTIDDLFNSFQTP